MIHIVTRWTKQHMTHAQNLHITETRTQTTCTQHSAVSTMGLSGSPHQGQVGDGRVEWLSMGPKFPHSQVTALDWKRWKKLKRKSPLNVAQMAKLRLVWYEWKNTIPLNTLTVLWGSCQHGTESGKQPSSHFNWDCDSLKGTAGQFGELDAYQTCKKRKS